MSGWCTAGLGMPAQLGTRGGAPAAVHHPGPPPARRVDARPRRAGLPDVHPGSHTMHRSARYPGAPLTSISNTADARTVSLVDAVQLALFTATLPRRPEPRCRVCGAEHRPRARHAPAWAEPPWPAPEADAEQLDLFAEGD